MLKAMLFFTTTPRFFVFLLGLLFVDGTMGQRECQDVPIHVDVNIQPANETEPVFCPADQELALRFHIQKVVDKRFDEFRRDSSVFEDIIVGDACAEKLPLTSNRRLMPFRGFKYKFGVGCRFCNDDDLDPGPPPVVTTEPSLSPALSPTEKSSAPSSAPSASFAPSPAPSSSPMPSGLFAFVINEEVARLTATLERQLTRKLTQKVNKNRQSCFRGSDSTVTVSVELEDFLVASRCMKSEIRRNKKTEN